jgi:hypothetical protein
MQAMTRYRNFEEFWPFYVREHSEALTRKLHFIGSLLALIILGMGFLYSYWLLLLVPFAGYGFAWTSHLFVEKNQAATFKYPLWSLVADYKMFYLMCLGGMDEEVGRCRKR